MVMVRAKRVVRGRVVCAGDCPFFEVTERSGRGYCEKSAKLCEVGQLCHLKVASKRYHFAHLRPRLAISPQGA